MGKDRKKLYGKMLALFFALIAICTIISRAADSMTIPKVTVQKAESGKISYTLKGDGTIEAVQKNTQLLPAGLLVEFCMEDKSSVEAGDVLIQFQLEQLEQRKEEMKTALEQANLQLEQAKLNQEENAWLPAAEEAQKTVDQAGSELNQAETALKEVQENYDKGMEALVQQEMEQGQGQDGVRQQEISAEREALKAALQQAQNHYNEASQQLTQAQQALESAQKSDEVTRKNNAKTQQTAKYTTQSAQLEADTAAQNLQKMEDIIAQDGKVCAGQTGIFLNTSVMEGTVTTGNEFVGIGTGRFIFTAEISKEAGEKLAEGDSIAIKVSGQEEVKVPIVQLTFGNKEKESENAESQAEVVFLKAELPENMVVSESYGNFSIQKESEEKYQNILPLTAIRQDSRGYYCLAAQSQDSILGEEIKAKRINVTLLDKDDTQAAVEGAIQADTKVIVTSEKDVLAGDRVRIKE